jgi:NitT/TauT family transport system permease protein
MNTSSWQPPSVDPGIVGGLVSEPTEPQPAQAAARPVSAVVPPQHRSRFVRRAAGKSLVAVVLVLTIVMWEAYTRLTDVANYLIPPPTLVYEAFTARPRVVIDAFVITFTESLLGFGLAAVAGILLAILIAQSSLMERLIYPYLNIIRVTPVIAIAPLLTIWFGHGQLPMVLVAALIAFFPIVVTTALGLKSVDPDLMSLMRLLNASRAQTLYKIQMPNALPYIFSAFRISAPLAVVGALVGEFVGASEGLGYLLVIARGRIDTSTVFLMTVLAAVMGVLAFALVVAFERRFVKWHPSVQLQ